MYSRGVSILNRVLVISILSGLHFFTSAQTSILFSRSKGALNSDGTLDIMRYNPVTKKTTTLMKGSVNKRGEYNAVTSPSGTHIIFNTYRFSGWKLAMGSLQNNKIADIRKLTNRKNYEYCAKFSPDGQKIVYQEYDWSDRSENLFIADGDGKNARLFFSNNVSDQNLSWTRDNKSIVFTHMKNGRLGIYSKSIDGKLFKKLSNSNANDFAASASHTEDRVAFLSDRTGKIDLFIMNSDGQNLKNLTQNLKTTDADTNNIWAYKVSWSPNGDQIVFNAMIGRDLELFIVNTDGTDLHQITNNGDSDITPFWTKANFNN